MRPSFVNPSSVTLSSSSFRPISNARVGGGRSGVYQEEGQFPRGGVEEPIFASSFAGSTGTTNYYYPSSVQSTPEFLQHPYHHYHGNSLANRPPTHVQPHQQLYSFPPQQVYSLPMSHPLPSPTCIVDYSLANIMFEKLCNIEALLTITRGANEFNNNTSQYYHTPAQSLPSAFIPYLPTEKHATNEQPQLSSHFTSSLENNGIKNINDKGGRAGLYTRISPPLSSLRGGKHVGEASFIDSLILHTPPPSTAAASSADSPPITTVTVNGMKISASPINQEEPGEEPSKPNRQRRVTFGDCSFATNRISPSPPPLPPRTV
ncbi:hypothetical protein GE061_020286 [Apolygus lucorum]|uniref:Uncharacterized protein n=1 Tax=Apolygus lucorum TaxID=248454 RepID=A0A6A4JS93_APOLU|nr:hypothetical protein GE061_020286 [Apolygus lucorum]